MLYILYSIYIYIYIYIYKFARYLWYYIRKIYVYITVYIDVWGIIGVAGDFWAAL